MTTHPGQEKAAADEPDARYAGGDSLYLDFFRLSGLVWRRKWLVSSITLVGALVGLAAAFLITPVYRAETILVPVSDDQATPAISALGGRFGGLASLAGIPIDSGNRNEEFIAVLKSREFTYRFLNKENLLPVLFARKFDSDRGEWDLGPDEDPPSLEDGYRLFNKKIRRIGESKSGNILTLAIEWKNAEQAASWANTLVGDVNRQIRDRAISDSEKNLEYLRAEVENTSVVEIRQVIFELMQEQISNIMLTNVREEYAFKVVDPAVPPEPEDFVRPQRMLIVAAGIFVGFLLGAVIAVFRGIARQNG